MLLAGIKGSTAMNVNDHNDSCIHQQELDEQQQRGFLMEYQQIQERGYTFSFWNNIPSQVQFDSFWSKVGKKTDNGCIEFIAGRHRQGYGLIWDRDTKHVMKAHRMSAMWYLLPFDPSLMVLHKCDNPPCINPNHLFQGTQQDNIRDMVRKGRNGFVRQFGEDNPMAKLTKKEVLIIREEQGTCKQVAKKYRVSPMTVSRIRNRKLWSHLQ